MRLTATASAVLCGWLAASAYAQTSPGPTPATSTINTTLVTVPALVRDKSGAMVYTLKADDFSLTDNGVPQKLQLEQDTDRQPLALVVAIETGGAAELATSCAGKKEDGCASENELDAMADLGPYLQALVGGVRHSVALVSFDSQPHLEQDFTKKMNRVSDAMQRLTPGDKGDAILDALNYSVDLLREQPPEYRRAILLISETVDRSSRIPLDQALHAISDTNTTIYSLAYSTPKKDAAHYAYENIPSQCQYAGLAFYCINPNAQKQGGCMAKDANEKQNKAAQAYDCAGQIALPVAMVKMAVIAAMEGMRRNTPESVALLTGGEYYKIDSLLSITHDLTTIANHVPNRYVLSFYPDAPKPGPHALELRLKNYPQLKVTARTSYWVDAAK